MLNGPSKYNIFIFGIAGSTKSSFINTVYTMLNRDHSIKNVAKVGGGSDHTTKDYQRYEFDDMFFNIWDAWGLDNKNYKQFELRRILTGELPNKYKMGMNWNNVQRDENLMRRLETTVHERKIHHVIFVVPFAFADDKDLLLTMKSFFNEIADVVGNPTVVITLVDQACDKIRENPNHTTNPSLIQVKKNVCDVLGIAPLRVHFGVNYHVEEKKSFNIDKNAFKIIYQALQYSQDQYIHNAKANSTTRNGTPTSNRNSSSIDEVTRQFKSNVNMEYDNESTDPDDISFLTV